MKTQAIYGKTMTSVKPEKCEDKAHLIAYYTVYVMQSDFLDKNFKLFTIFLLIDVGLLV